MASVNPQMVIRIAANTDELQKNLKAGEASIMALGPSVDKLERNWKNASDKIVQDAANIAVAVGKVGTSTMTAGQASSSLRTLETAMKQLTLAGQPIPAQMQSAADSIRKLHPELTKASSASSGMGSALGSLKSMLGGLGVAFSVGAVLNFAKGLADTADQLIKMRDKTGISVEGLQMLETAAINGGNTLEEVTKAVSKMQVNLAGGDKSVKDALDKVGLSFKDLRAMMPEQQFTTIALAIQKVHDPADQAKLRMLLFGKAGNEIAGTLGQDFAAIAQSAGGMTTKTAEALDAAGDRVSMWWRNFKGMSANFVIGIVDTVKYWGDEIRIFQLKTAAFTADTVSSMLNMLSKVTFGPASKELAQHAKDYAANAESYRKAADATSAALARKKTALETVPPASGAAGRALLAFGDDADEMKKKAEEAAKKAAAEITKLKAAADAMSGKKLIAETDAMVATFERLAKQGLRPTYDEQVRLNLAIAAASKVAEETGLKIPDAWSKVTLAAKPLGAAITNLTTGIGNLSNVMQPGGGLAAKYADDLGNIESKAISLIATLPAVPKSVDITRVAMENAAEASKEKLAKNLGVASQAFDNLARVAELSGNRMLGSMLTIGKTMIDTFASTGSPVQTAIAGAMAVFSAVADKLFKTEEKKVNDMRDTFIAAQGGFDALAKKAVESGTTIDALLRAKNVKDYDKAVAELTATMGAYQEKLVETKKIQDEIDLLQQKLDDYPDWKKMQEAAQKYGLDLAALGPSFQSARLHDVALELWNDFELLQKGGADTGAVLVAMGPKISDLVNQSMKFGSEIPEQFRPLIDSLIKSGGLVDENGRKIGDMSGLKFGAPLVSEVDKIVAAIKELVDALSNKLKPEIASIPTTIPIHVKYDYDKYEPPDESGYTPPEYANGTPGLGFVDFGKETVVKLHGREAVIPERAAAKLTGASSTLSTKALEAKLDQLLLVLPQAMMRAARDGALLAGA